MVFVYIQTHDDSPLLPEPIQAILDAGSLWLRAAMSEYRDPHTVSAGELMQLYHAGATITTPVFSNIDLEKGLGIWRIPAVNNGPRETPAGMALLLSTIDKKLCGRVWGYSAPGRDFAGEDIYLSGQLSRLELEVFLRGEFPVTLGCFGVPAPFMGMPGKQILTMDQIFGRPTADPIRTNPYEVSSSPGGLPPPPRRSGRRGINGPPDSGMTRYMDQGMGRDMGLGFPATHRRLAYRQPMPITANIIESSSSDDTSTNSDASESESDTRKRGTKKKNPKSKPQGKSQSKGQKKAQRRKQSSSESSESSQSESEDEPRRKPKKTVKKAKAKPIEGRRRRSPSDDEAAYSADEKRKKGKAKAPVQKSKPERDDRGPSRHKALEAPERSGRKTRGRTPSDDEGQAPSRGNKGEPSKGEYRPAGPVKKISEQKAQGASSGKAGKAQEGPSEGKHRGRIAPENVGPPRVDPAEQARLDALKAQNGYGVKRPEKSG
ncbi:MAG: hypothetical protein LQ337_006048 [Flavoplaca oasis]|nr:MAG: hypothetical protein LQ337_006048 [Flavoplaca oasis]